MLEERVTEIREGKKKRLKILTLPCGTNTYINREAILSLSSNMLLLDNVRVQ